MATVIDSNIFQPGSTWEIRATARDSGSEVELVLHRGFRRGLKGKIASAVHHTVGKFLWARSFGASSQVSRRRLPRPSPWQTTPDGQLDGAPGVGEL